MSNHADLKSKLIVLETIFHALFQYKIARKTLNKPRELIKY